jgi:hypothetical protein
MSGRSDLLIQTTVLTTLEELMRERQSFVTANRLEATFLLVASAGFALQIISGIEAPTVPPGLIIMLAAAALVAFVQWRWIPLLASAAALFLIVGFFASGAVDNLLDPSRLGVLIGAWVQLVALVVSAAAGIIAVIGRAPSGSRV